jgi:excisionase family DNA binding protein
MTTATAPSPTPLLTAKEAAAFLRIHTDDVYDMAASGQLPALRLGRRWRFELEAVLAAARFVPSPAEQQPTPEDVEALAGALARAAIKQPKPIEQPPVAPVKPKARPRRSSAAHRLATLDPYADLKLSA